MKAVFRFVTRQAQSRPLAVLTVALLLGVVTCQSLSPPLWLCALLAVAAAIACVIWRKDRRALAVLMLIAGFAAGMTRMTLAGESLAPVRTQYSVEMVGRIAAQPFNNPKTGRLIAPFELESVNGKPSSLRLRLYLRTDEPPIESIAYGQRLKLKGHIWQTDAVTNPYEFDFGAYLNRQGLSAYATAKLQDVEILGEDRDLKSVVVDLRVAVSRQIDRLFPNNAGLMRALVLGDRSLLSEELREELNQTGTGHLISISGLHVTVLAALLAAFLGLFLPKRWANLISVLLLIPYGALIGFNAPFVRALVMFALLCFAPVAGHPSDALTRLCAALLGYLLLSPLSVGDAGFVLSFSASAGILLLMPPLSALFGLKASSPAWSKASLARRLLSSLRDFVLSMLCASIAAQLATLPVVIAFFGVQSVISLPFNLICVPLCMLGYVTGLIVLLLSAVCFPLAALLARIPDGLFTLLTAVTRFSDRLPVNSVRLGRYSPILLLLHWGVVLAASHLSRIRLSIRKFLPFALLAVAGLASLITFARAWSFSLVFLDADQADCAVVRTHGHTYMIDAGDTYTPAADYLNATCLHLDGIVLSHPHQDHAGGLSSVLASFRPDAIYVPTGWFEVEEVSTAITEGIELAKDMGVEIREIAAGDVLRLSDVALLEVFSPLPGDRPSEVNDMSLLTLITCEGHTALFTGDLSVAGEPEEIPSCEVLKVAHHGSSKATSDCFLSQADPGIAVVSVGENIYGHPSPETLERLEEGGARVLLTRDCGAVTLTALKGGWRVDTYLEVPNDVE